MNTRGNSWYAAGLILGDLIGAALIVGIVIGIAWWLSRG